jgi:hypothetical protein
VWYWYVPGYISGYSDCCHCEAGCNHDAETSEDPCEYYTDHQYSIYQAMSDVDVHGAALPPAPWFLKQTRLRASPPPLRAAANIVLDMISIGDALGADPVDYAAAKTIYTVGASRSRPIKRPCAAQL